MKTEETSANNCKEADKNIGAHKHQDLEVKDAQIIFNAVWNELESEFGKGATTFPQRADSIRRSSGSGQGDEHPFHHGSERADLRTYRCQFVARYAEDAGVKGSRPTGRRS